jgi:NosR/NirI family transcriptional regulator, nitrous oxide reductase regulator
MKRNGNLGSIGKRAVFALLTVFLLLLLVPAASTASDLTASPDESRYKELFPEAERFGPVDGSPPAIAAYQGERLLGYVFSTRTAIDSVGYSGKPLDILAGVDMQGRLTGASLIAHQEPILMIGVSDADLAAFVAQFRGVDVRNPIRIVRHTAAEDEVTAISGATISSTVFNDAILRAARAVAQSRGIFGAAENADRFEVYAPASWPDLLADGSLVRLRLTVGNAMTVLQRLDAALPQSEAQAESGATFIDLYAGLATPARVGRNLLGRRSYERLLAELPAGDQLLFVAGQGLHSFKGTAFVRDGWFDRIQLVQGERTIRFRKEDYVLLQGVEIADAPGLREYAIFKLHRADGFSPAEDWRLHLMIEGRRADGSATQAPEILDYRLPAIYRSEPAADEAASINANELPLWERIWRGRLPDIAILVIALVILSGILVFQDFIARRKRLYESVRIGFLIFTLVWIGWYASAQLSVINVLSFSNALLSGFRWDFFLLEPLIFILWGYVAVALLFWGRGVFCGWLCPFGALQELSNKLAQVLRLPQWRVPFVLHERLWPIKYILFLGIFALFLGNADLSLRMAEVEPFKTAIVLHFLRGWPFVLYVVVLLGAGLLVNRFYCRYLCPLGAALAIPARLRMFEWLKRRWHCGNPCQQCAVSCPVQAIHPTGQISPNECIYCLRCQVNYHDEWLCPPLIERRKRRERRQGTTAALGEM